jgi:DNA-binding response OmpR family regulator
MTVLVVDDDIDMARMLKDTLERYSYRVIVSEHPGDALFLAEKDRPDAVVLDKEMPDMNGLELLPLLKDRLPGVPMILVTAFGGSRVAAEAFACGADRYLEKPFRMQELLAILRTFGRS